MPELSPQPLATGPRRMALLAFHRLPEGHEFDDAPVAYVLVVLRHEGRPLMVYVRHRALWELPGGGIEAGETPRAAAVRELWEETGQRVGEDALRFAGYAKTVLGADQRMLYGAVFTADSQGPLPFEENDEISAVHWRDGDEPLSGLVQTVDEYLIDACRG